MMALNSVRSRGKVGTKCCGDFWKVTNVNEKVHAKMVSHSNFWPGLLEAWLALTSIKYHGNLLVLIPLNQRLALTRLRTTGPWLWTLVWNEMGKSSIITGTWKRVTHKSIHSVLLNSFEITIIIYENIHSYHFSLFLCKTVSFGVKINTSASFRANLFCLATD